MRICEGECSETQYWLQVLVDAEMLARKDTDLIIKDGSLFDVTIPVDMVFIRGETVYRRVQN